MLIAVALALAGAVYLLAWPPSLGASDEAYFLRRAEGLAHGKLLYRDFWDFNLPLAYYLFALPFRLFGASIVVAKVTAAAVQGLALALLYGATRAAGVGRPLAVLPPLFHLAICVPSWAVASPHWVAVPLKAGIVWSLLQARARVLEVRRLVAIGLLLGLLIGVQHQNGLALAAGLVAIVALAAWQESASAQEALRRWLVCSAILGTAALAIVLPLLLAHGVLVGWEALWEQLVLHRLNFFLESKLRPRWAAAFPLAENLLPYTVVGLLRYSPLPILIGVLLWSYASAKGDRDRALRYGVLVVCCAVSAASILYYPDFIHVAFIAALPAVLAAVELQDLLRAIRPRWPHAERVLAVGVCAAGVAFAAVRLESSLSRATREHPYRAETAFGRVAFATQGEIEGLRQVERLIQETGAREIFSYPSGSDIYLLTGLPNATIHDLSMAGYKSADQVREIVGVLEEKKPPVVIVVNAFIKAGDPVRHYLESVGTCIPLRGSLRDPSSTPIRVICRRQM